MITDESTADGTPTAAEPLEHRRVRQSVREALFGRRPEPLTIGRFKVLERLGAGGMGVVYAAYDDALDRKVAIKLVRQDRTEGPAARERLRREARAAAQLSHPNVVGVFEVGEHEGRVFVAMEFVRGLTLRQWLAAEERGWREIRDAFVQAAQGLAAAHASGTVHRDFKPDNAMIDDDGRVRVLDFGLASAAGDEPVPRKEAQDDNAREERLTLTGELLGTPSYMAPEQRRGDGVDARSDQYSLCASLWEALYGRPPFVTENGTLDIGAAGEGRLPDASASVPPFVDEALRRGLSADPDDRFPSVDALARALAADPARRRRRIALGVVVGLAVASAAIGGYLRARPRGDACAPAAQRLSGLWDDSRRVATRRALVASDPALTLQAWTQTVDTVDRYVAEWSEVYDETCGAIEAGTDNATLLQRRVCLDWALESLSEQLDRLARGQSSARDAIAELPGPDTCTDDAAVRQRAAVHAARHEAPPPGSEDGLVSDFEADLAARFGLGWQWSTDSLAGGASTVDLAWTKGGAQGSEGSLRITGTVRDNGDRPSWAGAIFFPGNSPMAPANLSGKETVSFWARGKPGIHVAMVFTARTLLQPTAYPFEVGRSWQRYTFDLDELAPHRYDLTGLFWGVGHREGTFELLLDDVRVD